MAVSVSARGRGRARAKPRSNDAPNPAERRDAPLPSPGTAAREARDAAASASLAVAEAAPGVTAHRAAIARATDRAPDRNMSVGAPERKCAAEAARPSCRKPRRWRVPASRFPPARPGRRHFLSADATKSRVLKPESLLNYGAGADARSHSPRLARDDDGRFRPDVALGAAERRGDAREGARRSPPTRFLPHARLREESLPRGEARLARDPSPPPLGSSSFEPSVRPRRSSSPSHPRLTTRPPPLVDSSGPRR